MMRGETTQRSELDPEHVTSVLRAQGAAALRAAPELKTRSMIAGVDENVFTRPGPHVVEAAAELNRIIDRWERR